MASNEQITILDGSMGTALRRRGVLVPDYKTSFWSAGALLTNPDEVVALHRDYIRAGADVITTNNFAVTPASLATENMTDRLEELTTAACELAHTAREAEGGRARIAGSLPPLNISYRADLVGSLDELLPVYRQMVQLMAPHVDLFLCETMTTTVEARASAQAALEAGKPVWISFSLEDHTANLRGRETIEAAVEHLEDLEIDAFLINCTAAQAATRGAARLAAAAPGLNGVYCNPFRFDPPTEDHSRNSPDFVDVPAFVDLAKTWTGYGAGIVGSCCGSDPEYTRALREQFPRH